MSELETAEVQEPEVELNPLADLVDAALAKDYNKANEIFGQAVSVKLSDVMDQERIKVSGQIFNGDADEDDAEGDEDVLDNDSDVEDSTVEDDSEGDDNAPEEAESDEEVEN